MMRPLPITERREAREVVRLVLIRLRTVTGDELNRRNIEIPDEVGEALGMTREAAVALLNAHRWKNGDLELLEAAVAGLELLVPGLDLRRP